MEYSVKYKCKYMDIMIGDPKGILSPEPDQAGYLMARRLLPVPAFFRLTVQ